MCKGEVLVAAAIERAALELTFFALTNFLLASSSGKYERRSLMTPTPFELTARERMKIIDIEYHQMKNNV